MKIALCLSGQPRYIQEGFNYINEHLLKNNDVDVFIHVWHSDKLEGTEYTESPMCTARSSGPRSVSKTNIDLLKSCYKPVSIQCDEPRTFSFKEQYGEQFFSFLYGEDRQSNMLSMWCSIHKSNELKKEHERENGFVYDCVIRCRTDLLVDHAFDFKQYEMSKIHLQEAAPNIIEDIFAFSSSENMDIYASIFVDMLKLKSTNMNKSLKAPPHCILKYFISSLHGIQFSHLPLPHICIVDAHGAPPRIRAPLAQI